MKSLIGGLLLLLGLGLPAVAQTPPETPPATPAAKPEEAALPACGDCHADQAKSFGANAHARGKVKKGEVPSALCETCHGDGKAHIEGGGDKEKIYKPAGLAGSDKTCLACHDVSTDRVSHHAGMHANSAAVNCLTCHSIHSSDAHSPHLIAKPQLAL